MYLLHGQCAASTRTQLHFASKSRRIHRLRMHSHRNQEPSTPLALHSCGTASHQPTVAHSDSTLISNPSLLMSSKRWALRPLKPPRLPGAPNPTTAAANVSGLKKPTKFAVFGPLKMPMSHCLTHGGHGTERPAMQVPTWHPLRRSEQPHAKLLVLLHQDPENGGNGSSNSNKERSCSFNVYTYIYIYISFPPAEFKASHVLCR